MTRSLLKSSADPASLPHTVHIQSEFLPVRAPDSLEQALLSSTDPAGPNVRLLRRWRRVSVRVPASVRSALGLQSATIVDISRYGAGLSTRMGLKLGDMITIELGSGRAIDAEVRWCSGDRMGVLFIQPLAVDDDLLPVEARQSDTEASPATGAAASTDQASGAQPPPQLKDVLHDIAAMQVAASRHAVRAISGWMAGKKQARIDRNQAKVIERACRKQGFAWLVDEEANPLQGE